MTAVIKILREEHCRKLAYREAVAGVKGVTSVDLELMDAEARQIALAIKILRVWEASDENKLQENES